MADSQDDKLYKAEYAKSGRASCKLCKENIAKDSLRMAIIVQSPMFDGKVPHWHHFSCFWFRAAVKSPSDISGFTDLRWDDQEKVKKAIKSGSQNKKLYKAEYAKSRRTSCMLCQENIAKDLLRMAIMVQSPMFDGKVPHWHHFSCFWLRAAVKSPSDISGLTDLCWDDQEKVKKAIESGGATGGDLLK
ncbi:poly [ADP-ribose] polymerase 1-like [Megalobrama amblycephala]|uniref:poly [ADP-ribose] polymerase 1-like n=1 Tax=Megalobrama amblycephala TaxID=75352 RepID=UPI002013FC96|nr:poly [ADP-ribose] polymerase 1-like [Megalobrama amblycephala]